MHGAERRAQLLVVSGHILAVSEGMKGLYRPAGDVFGDAGRVARGTRFIKPASRGLLLAKQVRCVVWVCP